MWKLRRALGPRFDLRTEQPGYVLISEGIECDLAEFERLAASAADLLDDDPGAAADTARAAVRLWRGDPVAEDLGIAAVNGAPSHFETFGSAWRRCCSIPGCEALADEHPFREDIRALHLLALYRSGRQTEALAAYRRTRDLLVEELGVEPGPELRALHRQILDQDEDLELRQLSDDDRIAEHVVTLTTDHRRALLVLDNCEHVAAAAAPLKGAATPRRLRSSKPVAALARVFASRTATATRQFASSPVNSCPPM